MLKVRFRQRDYNEGKSKAKEMTVMSENTLMNTDNTAEKPRRKKGWRTVALALCCSLIGGLAGAGGVAAYDGWFRAEPERPAPQSRRAKEANPF